MDRKVAKELLHVRDWVDHAQHLVARGHEAYTTDDLLQEAGDSLMMKLGEAAGRLASAGIKPPPGVAWTDAIATRNWLIHQYDEIDRSLTWVTLSLDLTSWLLALTEMFGKGQASTLPGATDGKR
jgi:uncharacterized protein with HEPN domain